MACQGCRAAVAGLDQATALWPQRSTASDGICGDPAHAARVSDHNPDSRGIAHAFDLTHDPAHGCDAHGQAEKIRLRAKARQEPRLKYVISNRRIASPDSNWNWVPYSGDNPHEHHAHFSINTARENDTSPWYTIGGLSMADVKEVLDAIRNQSRINQEVTRNQGEQTREAVTANAHAVIVGLRRTIWRAAGKSLKEIDDLEAQSAAEFDALLAALTPDPQPDPGDA